MVNNGQNLYKVVKKRPQWYVEMAFELEKWLSLTTTTATHTDYRVRMRKSATIVNNLTTVMVLLILAYNFGQS